MISGQSGHHFQRLGPTFVRQPQTRSTEPSDRGALFQKHISAGHPARHCAGTYWGHPARHATWPCPRAGRAGDDTTDQDRHHGQAPPTAEHSPVTCTRTDSRQNPPGDTQHKISARNRNSGLSRLSGRPGSCRPQTSLEAAAGFKTPCAAATENGYVGSRYLRIALRVCFVLFCLID